MSMAQTDKDLDFSPKASGVGAAAVPRYILYGDAGSRADWFVNLERLERRGRERGWVIAPHTHPRFTQIMILARGGGEISIEGDTCAFARGSVVIVPPFRIHALRYTEETGGWVLTIDRMYLSDLLVRAPALAPVLGHPTVFEIAEGALASLEEELGKLARELEEGRVGAAIAAETHLMALLLLLLRNWPPGLDERGASGLRRALVLRYEALLDARYREQPPLTQIADALGVSVSQLRSACRAVTGLPPIALMHDRILSEAKRCLAYTGMSVAEIAQWLGFSEASYFSRFFTRLALKNPTMFRREQAFDGGGSTPSRDAAGRGLDTSATQRPIATGGPPSPPR